MMPEQTATPVDTISFFNVDEVFGLSTFARQRSDLDIPTRYD